MQNVVIVGANRGIGLEYVRQYLAQGSHVTAVCRKASAELQALDVEMISGVDVASEDDIKTLRGKLAGKKIDILINNAGIFKDESIEDFNIEQIKQQFYVNTLGPLATTVGLLSLLHEGSKVIMTTSRMGSVTDNTSGGRYGYRMSKCALNMGSKSLAEDLKPKGIAVGILHPGYVKTDMTDNSGNISPKESVEGMIKLIDNLSMTTTGTFWHTNGEPLPWQDLLFQELEKEESKLASRFTLDNLLDR